MRRIQREEAKKVILEDFFNKPITNIAGMDIAFIDNLAIVACVIIDYNSLDIRCTKTSLERLDFPYISTFLSFREGPPLINLINTLEFKPDIFIINAQGIAHPRYCGCASYVGIQTNVPTIGVTIRKLWGIYNQEPKSMGNYVALRFGDQTVGWVLKSNENCKPIFISPGHLVSLESSLDIVMKCIRNHKLPEPLHHAHILANEEKRRIILSNQTISNV